MKIHFERIVAKYQKVDVSKKTHVKKSGPFCFGMAFYLMLEALDALKMKY